MHKILRNYSLNIYGYILESLRDYLLKTLIAAFFYKLLGVMNCIEYFARDCGIYIHNSACKILTQKPLGHV